MIECAPRPKKKKTIKGVENWNKPIKDDSEKAFLSVSGFIVSGIYKWNYQTIFFAVNKSPPD